jgi:hypothetical protein
MQHPPAPGQPSGPLQRSGAPQPNCPFLGELNLPIFDFEISLFRLVLPQPVQVSPLVLSLPATMCSHICPQSAHWNSYKGIVMILYWGCFFVPCSNLIIVH